MPRDSESISETRIRILATTILLIFLKKMLLESYRHDIERRKRDPNQNRFCRIPRRWRSKARGPPGWKSAGRAGHEEVSRAQLRSPDLGSESASFTGENAPR